MSWKYFLLSKEKKKILRQPITCCPANCGTINSRAAAEPMIPHNDRVSQKFADWAFCNRRSRRSANFCSLCCRHHSCATISLSAGCGCCDGILLKLDDFLLSRRRCHHRRTASWANCQSSQCSSSCDTCRCRWTRCTERSARAKSAAAHCAGSCNNHSRRVSAGTSSSGSVRRWGRWNS